MNIKIKASVLLLLALTFSYIPITAVSIADNGGGESGHTDILNSDFDVSAALPGYGQAYSSFTTAYSDKVNLIENGDFSDPVIIKDILTSGQTESDAGWYAKFSEDSKTRIFQIHDDENTFLRVTDVTSGQRGVYFNSGVILQPGKYVLNAHLRISESADNGGMWRDLDKNTMQMRINLQDSEKPNSPQYSLNNSVDKDTVYSGDGNVIGTLEVIGREWTVYTDTITVDKPTLGLFKIGGGVSGAVDAHGFDIDNITLVPVVYGDANYDNKVNPLDPIYILRYLGNWEGYNSGSVNIFAVDLDKDGEITYTDAIILCRHLAKWIGYGLLPYLGSIYTE